MKKMKVVVGSIESRSSNKNSPQFLIQTQSTIQPATKKEQITKAKLFKAPSTYPKQSIFILLPQP